MDLSSLFGGLTGSAAKKIKGRQAQLDAEEAAAEGNSSPSDKTPHQQAQDSRQAARDEETDSYNHTRASWANR